MELRSELSKQYIAEAFLHLLKNNDYDKISVQQIADKAGLSHMAYYRNFKSKDEILIYHLDKITGEFIKNSNINFATQTTENALRTLFKHLYNHLELGQLLLKINKLHLVQIEFDKYFLLHAQNEHEKYSRLYLSGGTFRLYCEWLKSGAKLSPKEIAAYICNLI